MVLSKGLVHKAQSEYRRGRAAHLALIAGALAGLALVTFSGRVAQAQLPPPAASDTASDSAYDPPSPPWTTGDNGGFGMGAWTLQTISPNPSENGHFVGSSTGNNGMSGDTNGDGDINTPISRAWGLYANSGQTASTIRDFDQPFTPGSVFEIWMDNGDVQSGGTVGFALQNASGQELLEVYFVGGAMQYTVHGSTPILSGVGFTREGVRVIITQTTASTYQATLIRLVDGASATVSGNLRSNPGPISRLRLFNANAGSGSDYDLFFNRIFYYRGRVLNADTGTGYLNIQPAISDPATQDGHTLQVSAGTFTGTITVTKQVTIVGAGPGQTVIQSLSPGIVVTQSNVTISNTSIVGAGSDAGITTTFGVTGLKVLNVHISNFAQGVTLLGGHSHVVQSSVLTLTNVITGVGVGMTGVTTTLPITNVLVSGNVLTASGYAVVGIFVADSQIVGNAMRNGIAGVRLAGANNNRVESNEIRDNASYGIYFAPNAPPLISTPALNNANNVISGNVALNHPTDRGIQIINAGPSGNSNQIINNIVRNTGGEGIFIGAGSGEVNLLVEGNQVENSGAASQGGIYLAGSQNVTVSANLISGHLSAGLTLLNSGDVRVTGNTLITSSVGLSITNSATHLVTATLNNFSGNNAGAQFTAGSATGLRLNRNRIVGNTAGITNTASGLVNAGCNWYGAADGPSGFGPGSGDSVSAGVGFNPWLTSDDLNGPCSGTTLVIEKVIAGPITPTTAWVFTASVPTGTLAFTLPASGGSIAFPGLNFGQAFITETAKLGYVATSACSTGGTGSDSIAVALGVHDTITCTFTNVITPVTTVITVTPVLTNGWAYITETVGPGVYVVPFDIVLPPPAPTLGEASARLAITDVAWRHMYVSPIFTGTLLSDISVFEYRLRIPSTNAQTPYINIGWDDDVTDSNTGFRGRLVYSPGGLAPDTWHIVDARNDPTPRWYTTLFSALACTSSSPCTFAQIVAAYPNAAIHPGDFLGAPLGFVGIRAGGGSSTGVGYADGLRIGVGSQVTLYDFEAAPPTTVTLQADPTTTVVGSSALLTATVLIGNGEPAADGTVVSFDTTLGAVSPVTATTVGGVATAAINSTVAGVATVTATVGTLEATTLVTFTPGAPYTLTLAADPTTLVVGNSSALTATVTDQYGNAVADGTTVSFTTDLGTLANATATTSGGDAPNTLSSTTPGAATVTATVGSLEATTLVTFTPGAPYTVTLTLSPAIIYANGISQSVAVATLTDQYGNPVPGVTVQFFAGVGAFSPTSSATNASGQASVNLTSLTPAIENVFAVVSGMGFAQAQMIYVNPPAAEAPLSGALDTVTQTLGAVRKGDLITYTIVVTNTGAGQVNNVLIFAPIPSGTTYVAGSASGGNYSGGSSVLLLSGAAGAASPFGPQAALSGVTWAGNLPGGVSHTLSYVVQTQILEGQVVNTPKVFVDNADTGINLSSTVDVTALKVYLPILTYQP